MLTQKKGRGGGLALGLHSVVKREKNEIKLAVNATTFAVRSLILLSVAREATHSPYGTSNAHTLHIYNTQHAYRALLIRIFAC